MAQNLQRLRMRSTTVATSRPAFKKEKPPPPATIKKDYTERVMKDVPAPEWKRLTTQELFDAKGIPDPDVLRDHLLREGRLEPDCAHQLITKAQEQLTKEPNLLYLNVPITVVGDIHGQFYDLVNIIEAGGDPAETQYIFLGDYVDRGCFGTEVAFYLFALKIKYPDSFWLLRGNHECRLMTGYFNFKTECKRKYNISIYEDFVECFDAIPLAACINSECGSYFCCHGGLSPEIETLDDIKLINRFIEPPKTGPLCDLLWSDPIEEDSAEGLGEEEMERWYNIRYMENPTRGCGYVFGFSAVAEFLDRNDLLSVVRAHEVQDEGFRLHHFLRPDRPHPLVITVFSAPNYCDFYCNQAAILKLDDTTYGFQQIGWADHPFYLPDMMDGLTWSLPFVLEKLTEIFMAVLKICEREDEEQQPAPPSEASEPANTSQLHERMKVVGKTLRLMKQVREEREQVLTLKEFAADLNSDKDSKGRFAAARERDLQNERLRPLQKEILRRRTKTL